MKTLCIASALAILLSAPAYADSAAEVWKAKCKGCHGEDGRAKTKVGEKEKIHDFSTPAFQKHHSDEDIKTVILYGSETKPKMKGFKDKLSQEEIDALVKYIRDLASK